MSIKNIAALFIVALVGSSISPSYSGDAIFCSGFEECPAAADPWTTSGNNIYYLNNVGIGSSTPPATRLHVRGGGGITIEDENLRKFGANSIEFSSHILPQVDNNRSLGLASKRFTAVYAANGTINTSDAREKKNIKSLSYGLDEVMMLNPVSFEWKSGANGKTKLGLIAQEVEAVIPEVIYRPDPDAEEDSNSRAGDVLGMYYSDLIPVLIKAIHEQEEKILQLQAEVQALKRN